MAKRTRSSAKAKSTKTSKAAKKSATPKSPPAKYPRHSVEKALRIPNVILEQNAGKPCPVKQSATYLGVGSSGPYQVEVSSGIKYGFLERTDRGVISVAERAKRILRPQSEKDKISGLQEAVTKAPVFSDVYGHYRGENLPDTQFFHNALADKFKVPSDKVAEFAEVFLSSLRAAELLHEHDGKERVIDVSSSTETTEGESPTLKRLERDVKVTDEDSCFVAMPFSSPIGGYYESVYKPAIEKAGLRPVRADDDIFGAGKIIQQIWSGIQQAKVLVAEMTQRNPNVFYELGLAHALQKPVVLVSSNEDDVPFDLQHIRVIYYDVNDPFWGNKLINKVAENILSAIKNPEEAILKQEPSQY